MKAPTRTVAIVRLCEDDAGESRFVDEDLPTATQEFAPPAPAIYLAGPWDTKRSLVLLLPEGWFGELHAAPARQIMTMVSGALEVTTSKGETRQFRRGSIVLVEDVHGKGHATRSLEGDAVVLVAQL